MSGLWSGRSMLAVGLMLVAAALPAWGQAQATFTGVGVLSGDATSLVYSVSPNGDYVAGESLGDPGGEYANGTAQAFIYGTGTGAKTAIGYPTGWAKSSGHGVDVDSDGHIHVAGTGKNASGNNQAFYYDVNTASFSAIPFLTGGSVSQGQAIRWHGAPLADVVVAGISSRSAGYDHGFMWKKSTGSLTDLWNTPSSSEPHQSGVDSPCDGAFCLAFRGTRMVVRGTGETQYGCGNFSPAAFNYDEGGQYWYNYLLYWTQFAQCPPLTVSTAYGTSQNGDWIVGSSTFDESAWWPSQGNPQPSCSDSNRMAYLFNQEDYDEHDHPLQVCVDHVHGPFKSRMLGFLAGHEGFSEGWGVSGDGAVVVGRASKVGGASCTWLEANYVAFIWDATNGMRNLQTVLASPPYSLDLTGWELTEARAISTAGTVICGFGLHNGQWEGWVVTIGRSGSVGACCHSDLTCSETDLPNCQGTFHSGQTCAATICCHTPFADSDGDGDVDQDDFGAFQICYTGTNGGVPTGCACFNRAGSMPEGIDSSDFEAFANCWSGPNVAWTQAAAPLCQP